MTKEEIGHVLRQLRMKANLTQKQAAQAMGRTQQIIGHWETGYSQPDADSLFALCEIYGASVDKAFGFTKKSSAPAEAETEEDNIKNKLFKSFMELNVEGREKLCGYADDLVMSGKYTKNNSSDVCADA